MTNKKKYTNCDSVYKNLQNYFAKKNFGLSDRVPSERQIADDLGVNRTTLRTAMHRMVKDGLLERQVGVGTFFKICPKEMAENYTKINTKCSIIELMEARITLEPKLASLAALNITANDIKLLKNICKTNKKTTSDVIEKMDINFHDMIAEISKNFMLKQMYDVISDLRKKLMKPLKDVKCDNYECIETWNFHQSNIISALEKKNPKAAHNSVKEKLNCILGQYSVINLKDQN